MKSAGVSDSDSGSNGSNHPLQRRSPNRTSRSQGSRRLSAKTPNVPPPGKLITVQGDTGAELLRGDSALPSLFENESVFESHLGLARTPSDDAPRQSSPNYSFTFLRSASASRPRSFTRESARDPQSMTLDIGTLTGSFGIQTRATDCVRDLKRNIQDSQGISAAGQILLWQGEVLADNAMIGTIGLENGSKLRLALNMSTGSGPPLKSRKAASEDDSVVFLLCKEDDDMYMLEFHMGEGQDGHLNRKDMLRMAEVAGIEVLQELANDAHSVYVRNLRSGSYLSSQDDNRHQQKPRTPSLSRKRPTSGDTDASTSSLLSYNTPFSSNDHTPDRPLSPLSSGQSRPSSGDSILSDLFDDVFSFCGGRGKGARAFGCPQTPRRRLRPATAISVMRLPGGSGPMIIIPSARPASAVHPRRRGRSVLDDTPPVTPPYQQPQYDRAPAVQSSSPTEGSRPRRKVKKAKNHSRSSRGSNCSVRTVEDHTQNIAEHVEEFTSAPIQTRVIRNASVSITRKESTDYRRGLSTRGNSTASLVDRPRSKRELKPISPRVVSSVCTIRRCFLCRKKLGPATSFKCRCNQIFCCTHRYSDRHPCSFDYRTAGKAALVKENPLIRKEKLAKI